MLGNWFRTPWKIAEPFRLVGLSSPLPQVAYPGGADAAERSPHAEATPPALRSCTERPPSAVAGSKAVGGRRGSVESPKPAGMTGCAVTAVSQATHERR